ncbi:MAG: hypothetical protein HRU09_02600 [Oligoflexales bacterium]|nr:hypothetical protein [Oligoflexales bacterium]
MSSVQSISITKEDNYEFHQENPLVCVVDEDSNVELGWRKSLGRKASLVFFDNPYSLLDSAYEALLSNASCFILGRIFGKLDLDIVKTNIPNQVRRKVSAPIFLNWQGYIAKNDLDRFFDGKIFQRYGVKWSTLRQRMQRVGKVQLVDDSHVRVVKKSNQRFFLSKEQRCLELLKMMACNAQGAHRDKIESYIAHDQNTGIQLLEAIYNRLITLRDIPQTCPSRYINSSPVIAARILEEALMSSSQVK